MPEYVWLILFVAGVLVSFLGGKKIQFRALCKELGEGFAALDEFLGKEDWTKEDAEKLRKEWMDVIKAAGDLFGKVVAKAFRYRVHRVQSR